MLVPTFFFNCNNLGWHSAEEPVHPSSWRPDVGCDAALLQDEDVISAHPIVQAFNVAVDVPRCTTTLYECFLKVCTTKRRVINSFFVGVWRLRLHLSIDVPNGKTWAASLIARYALIKRDSWSPWRMWGLTRNWIYLCFPSVCLPFSPRLCVRTSALFKQKLFSSLAKSL